MTECGKRAKVRTVRLQVEQHSQQLFNICTSKDPHEAGTTDEQPRKIPGETKKRLTVRPASKLYLQNDLSR